MTDDSYQSGWGFNKQDGYYILCIDPVGDCGEIKPVEANLLSESLLLAKPLFKKDADNMFLYTDAPLKLTDAKVEELLANDIPALTFGAGHK